MSAFESSVKSVQGQYISPQSVTELATSERGVARVTPRRAILMAADQMDNYASSSTVASIGDIMATTTAVNGTFVAATAAFFDGSDAGFGATARYIKIPMIGWRGIGFTVYHTLGSNLTVDLYAAFSAGNSLASQALIKLASATLATGSTLAFGPFAGGSGASANYFVCEALQTPMAQLHIGFTPASDPSSGEIRIFVTRRS